MGRMGTGLRCFVASLVFLCLAGHSLALAAGVSCQNNNPFIKIMATQGIKLYTEPKKVDSICRSEFETYGTCCDETQLVRLAREDRENITADHHALVKEYTSLVGIAKDLVAALAFVSKSSLSHPRGTSALYQKVTKAKQAMESEEVKYLKSHVTNVTAVHIQQFTVKNLGCWMALSRERDASICPSCSGRSQHFFKNDKILITEAKCDQLAEVCREPMLEISRIYRITETLRGVTAHIADAGILISWRSELENSAEVQVFSEWLKQQKEKIKDKPVKNKESNLLNNHKTPKQNNKPLCEVFVRMRERIMVDQMTKVLRQYTGMAVGIETSIAQFLGTQGLQVATLTHTATGTEKKPSTGRPRDNWSVGGRLLQFNGSPPALGSDATFVNPTDPSYTSVGVSGHGPVADGSSFP